MTPTNTPALLTADDLATVAQQAKDSTVHGLNNLIGAPRLGELDDRTWYDPQVTPVLMDELRARALELDHHRATLLAQDESLLRLILNKPAEYLPAGTAITVAALRNELHRRDRQAFVAPRMHPCTPSKCVFPDGDPNCPTC
jgi:hypothetical protein